MDLQVQGKVALVTGAGGGLGGAIARARARGQGRVAAADRDEAALVPHPDIVHISDAITAIVSERRIT